ncbi:alpha/beta hydrolase family protein [Echinicola sediminis]
MSSFRTIELSDLPYERDGLRFMTVKSANLQGRGDICLYVPTLDKEVSSLPIYILLHGVYGSAWVWAMKGGLHHTAQQLMDNGAIGPAIIAMPSDGLWGDGSAYFTHHSKSFDQWIVSDVPKAIIENIPEADVHSTLCIGGLSMGGFGALSLGARFPEKFRAISGHSSITSLSQMPLFAEEALEEYSSYCDNPDVIDLLVKNREKLPKLRFDCGKSDFLLEHNRTLNRQLQAENIPHTYEEFEGGHEWGYWQKYVALTLRFFDQEQGVRN